MKTRDTSALSDEEVIHIAQAAVNYTRNKLPLGSVNKQEDTFKPDYYQRMHRLEVMRNHKKALQQRIMFSLTFTPNSSKISSLQIKARIYEKYQVGNCKEQTVVALAYLKEQGFDDVDHCMMRGADHAFLLLNGRIICDPWANKVYHVRDFEKEREAAKQFRYAHIVYDEMPCVRSYMSGVPYVKRSTGQQTTPSIVRGQFVRSGVANLHIDYSEVVADGQAELDRIYGVGVKTCSLDDFLVTKSRVTSVEDKSDVSMERRYL